MLAFALQSPLASGPASPIDEIADLFTLVRGIKTVLRSTCFDCIVKGKFKAMLDYNWHPTIKPLQDDVRAAFDHLTELNMMVVRNPDFQETYASASQSLEKAFATYSVISDEKSLVFRWTIDVPDLYLILVKRREPLALIILAYFGLLLHSINGIWWSEGRGARLIEAIYQDLPPTWQSELQWPRDIIQGKRAMILGA